jgi:hypothetical protein
VPCRAVGDAAQNNKPGLCEVVPAAQEPVISLILTGRNFTDPNRNSGPSAADIGLTRKQIHEARAVRDAEENDCSGPVNKFPFQPYLPSGSQ